MSVAITLKMFKPKDTFLYCPNTLKNFPTPVNDKTSRKHYKENLEVCHMTCVFFIICNIFQQVLFILHPGLLRARQGPGTTNVCRPLAGR